MGNINNSEVKTYKGRVKWIPCDRCHTQVVLDDELAGQCMTCGEEIIIVFPDNPPAETASSLPTGNELIECFDCGQLITLEQAAIGWCTACSEVTVTAVEWTGVRQATSKLVENRIKHCLTADQIIELYHAAERALADLEDIMPEFEPSGDREHPGWQTIGELKSALNEMREVRP
ncbi:MAG: hypothetical protein GY832_11295 [Chloroflexi bacterium]|nr:hypothetical protein [Chloroflexota bacterium]